MLYARNILWQRSRWFALLIWLMIHAIAGISPAASGERGLLWKMESANTPTSYLFGTIHTDDERVREFSPKLKQAMQQCQSFMMEIAPASDMSAAFLPHGTLRDLLQPEEIDKVLRLVDQLAMHDEVALRMKPWLLAAVLSLPRPQSPWYQDVLLYYLANDLNLQLLGIETPAEHYSALDSLSQEEQLTLLRTVLDQTQEEKEKAFEMVLQAYLDKDAARCTVGQGEKRAAGPAQRTHGAAHRGTGEERCGIRRGGRLTPAG